MNRKGFTIVELLTVIVIIALIGGIAAIAYSSFQNQTAKRVFETYMDNMHESTVMYFLDNPSARPTSTEQEVTILLKDLNIDKFNNPFEMGDYCVNDGSYVSAKKLESGTSKGITGIKYNVCLNCKAYKECKEYTN